jgi:ferric iron reductase protein FhuF
MTTSVSGILKTVSVHTVQDYSVNYNNTSRSVICEDWHFTVMTLRLLYILVIRHKALQQSMRIVDSCDPERVSDCSQPTQQFFNYIMAKIIA